MSASAQGRGDWFLGYSFTSSGLIFTEGNGTVIVGTAGRALLNGWDASVSLKLLPFIRGFVDVAAGCGALPIDVSTPGLPAATTNLNTNLHTYLLGPRAAISVHGFTLFAHALFGLAHEARAGDPFFSRVKARGSALALELGGGLDVPLVSRVAGRIEGGRHIL